MLDKLLNFMAVPRGPSEMGAFNGLAQVWGKSRPLTFISFQHRSPNLSGGGLALAKTAYCAICHSIVSRPTVDRQAVGAMRHERCLLGSGSGRQT